MNASPHQLLVNRYLRALRYPGFIGGRVQGGLTAAPHEAGVGDCALFDFTHGVFAVADGSDRNPSASRQFMTMFSRMLKYSVHPWTGRFLSIAEVSDMEKTLTAETERLLCSMTFGTGCTFTGVLLLRTVEGMAAIVMHTGDSLLISCDLGSCHTCQFTVDNFWMVGRSQRFFQIETLPVTDSTRLLLATDGLSAVPFPPETGREKSILGMFESCSPDEIPDRIFAYAGPPAPGRDDTSVIAINPSALVYLPQCLILGGTGIHEEKIFQEERARGLADQYAPVPSSDECLTI